MLCTTRIRTSVPMWGLASYTTLSGAPWAANCSRTQEMRGSWVPVFSFPSEKVPAPPSPNWTLQSGSSAPPARKASTAALRLFASLPRSITRGLAPAFASSRAANMPAGPKPATTGRSCRAARGIS